MKVGVLYNPHARANKKTNNWLPFWQSLNVDVNVLEKQEDLSKVTESYSSKKYDLIIVSGGDGTVQHLQTAFGNLKSDSHLPMLCLLPHGTTNMTAADIGLKAPSQTTIRSILTRKDYLKRATNIKERATIRVDNIKDTDPQFGVFFGAGALCEAVRKFHRGKANQKLTGHLATAKILISEILNAFMKRNGDEETIYKGYEMKALMNDRTFIEGAQLFLLISTLDKLILGSEPFWNAENGKLKITSTAWPLKRNLLAAVYEIMFAQDRSSLRSPDYISTSGETLDLFISDGFFTMDGEIFEPEKDKPLKISLGPKFKYLCG